MTILRAGLFLALAFLSLPTAARAGQLLFATWSGSFQGNPYSLSINQGTLCGCGANDGQAGVATAAIEVDPQRFTTLQTGGAAPVFISQTLGVSQASQRIRIDGGGVSANQGIAGRLNAYNGFDATGLLLFSVPLTIGVTPGGGNPFHQITALAPGFNIPVTVTVSAFGWTTGAFTFTGSTQSGVAIPTPFVASGSHNAMNANGVGTITLIAPSVISVCAGAAFSSFPCNGALLRSTRASVVTLTLEYVEDEGEQPVFCVPEPGVALLLGAGLVALAAGRRSGPAVAEGA